MTSSSRTSGYSKKKRNTKGNISKKHPAASRSQSKPKTDFLGKLSEILNDMRTVARDKNLRVDMKLLVLVSVLVGAGTVLMFSASYPSAIASRECNYDGMFYLKKTVIFAVVGFILMLMISFFPAKKIKDFTFYLVALSYLLLLVVFICPSKNRVHRWIFFFQPSEITKFVMIVFCASWMDTNHTRMRTFKYGVLPFVVVGGTTAVLLFLEPHVSCMVIVLLLMATMMYVGGTQNRWFAGLGGVAAAGLIFLTTMRNTLIENRLFARIYGRLDAWKDPFSDPTGDSWQNIQALYAISSGGLTGQGIGLSRQKYLYIPEPQNDFVFSVVCEEVGFIGAVIIILVFMIFVWRGFTISANNSNRFCKLLGIGITAQIGWQALLNFMVVTMLAPNTGISLPFFSYGGTSLTMLLAEIGVLLSISRESAIKRV